MTGNGSNTVTDKDNHIQLLSSIKKSMNRGLKEIVLRGMKSNCKSKNFENFEIGVSLL